MYIEKELIFFYIIKSIIHINVLVSASIYVNIIPYFIFIYPKLYFHLSPPPKKNIPNFHHLAHVNS